MAKLTSKFIENAICPPEINRKTYYDELGLQLRISRATQAKLWLFQYRWDKKLTQISLGPYPQISLAKARAERDRLRSILQSGVNPRTTKELEKTKNIDAQQHTIKSLYEAVCSERLNAQINPWSAGHVRRTNFIWKHLKPLYMIPIGNLTKAKLRDTLVSIHTNIGTATGQQAKNIMSMIYNYAEMNEYVPKNLVRDFAKDPILRKPRPSDVKPHPYIEPNNLGKAYYLMQTGKASHANKYFLMILSYTALRVSSLINLKWSDYDEMKSILVIPKQIVKNRRAINCPLPYQAKVMLSELKQIQQNLQGNRFTNDMFIFSEDGKQALKPAAASKYLERLMKRNELPHSVLHGFRTQCLINWSKQKFVENAIRIQMDHAVTGSSAIQDRYLGSEEYMSERIELVTFMANHIESEIKQYQNTLADQ